MTFPLAAKPVLLRATLLASCLLALSCREKPSAEPAREVYRVEGGFIRDGQGRAVVLRGANVSGDNKHPPYFGFQTVDDLKKLRSLWGMNAIRFLVSWSALEPAKGTFDAAYVEAVAARIDWAHEAGLLVVLDMHQDLYGEGFGDNGAPRWTCDEWRYEAFKPIEPWFANYFNSSVMACFDKLYTDPVLGEHYAMAWRQLSARLANHPAVLGFDVMNEPFWGSAPVEQFEQTRLQPFYERIVAAVRQDAPSWLAFLEPATSRSIGYPTGLTRPSFDNLVYAPHCYDSGAESGMGFDPRQRQNVLDKLASFRREANAMGAALWVGEYGGMAAAPGFAEYMNADYDGAAATAASSMYWHHGKDNLYGMLAPDGTEKPAAIAALIRPYPERVAGTPSSFAYDEATKTFTVNYRPDRGISAPTVLSVPAAAYPQGAVVECGGCPVQIEEGRISVLSPPEGEVVTLTVRPGP